MADTPQAPKKGEPEIEAPDFLVTNIFGIRPVKAEFHLTIDDLEELIKRTASETLSDIRMVTHQVDNRNGVVAMYLWLDANSEYFVDKRTEKTMLRGSLPRISEEMQTFCKKFGWAPSDDDPKNGSEKVNLNKIIVKNINPEASGRMVGIQLSINPFLIVAFDGYGEAYKKNYGKNAPKVFIRRQWRWKEGAQGKYTNLVGIEIEKSIASAFQNREKPRARTAGRFN